MPGLSCQAKGQGGPTAAAIQAASPWRKCGIPARRREALFVAGNTYQGALRQERNCGLRGRDFPPSRRTTAKPATPVAIRRAWRAAPNISLTVGG